MRARQRIDFVYLSKYLRMKAALNVELSFEQVLNLVKQLPSKDKIKLSKELEREAINSKLTKLLKTFRTEELSLETIIEEVELVRKANFESKKHEGHF